MAKEITLTKNLKITEAQQYMILAVLGASLVLGVSIALTKRFTNQISFNTRVIMEEEKAIADYSNVIREIGICKSPKNKTYSDTELQACDPASIEVSEIPGSLRANILENLAANSSLSSVPKIASSNDTSCINPETNKTYTYEELNKIYDVAVGSDELTAASNLIKSCSALRVIPDALPAFSNNEALMASLNKLFILSNWEPEALSPSGESEPYADDSNMNVIPVGLTIKADSGTTKQVLYNIEHSIREFDITSATIEWSGDNSIVVEASARAYYVTPTTLPRYTTVITENNVTSRNGNSSGENE
ncbi:hypothetical protein IKE87_02045 [Candidatus Saccharibacteria bacterium]|nr:hypothetical protein [Candidatus Saccharibacteria bacterium]